MKTIYQMAQVAMNEEIARYLELLEKTNGLATIEKSHLSCPKTAELFAGGIGTTIPENTENIADFLVAEHQRKSAIIFDVETAVCIGVYNSIRPYAKQLYSATKKETKSFTHFDGANIKSKPHLLPVLQSTLKLSKSQLKKKVGSVSDISRFTKVF